MAVPRKDGDTAIVRADYYARLFAFPVDRGRRYAQTLIHTPQGLARSVQHINVLIIAGGCHQRPVTGDGRVIYCACGLVLAQFFSGSAVQQINETVFRGYREAGAVSIPGHAGNTVLGIKGPQQVAILVIHGDPVVTRTEGYPVS